MESMLLVAAITGIVLLIGEWLWQRKITKGEIARKFVHIIIATFAAFWPIFLNRIQIVVLSLIFVVVLIIVKKLKIFRSIHSVKRVTYGEIWYAIGVCSIALLFKDNIIYAIAILHLALADGFAAVVGSSLAKKAGIFYFRGYRKSLAGSLTFMVISFILNLVYWLALTHTPLAASGITLSPVIYSLLTAIILAAAEISAPKGSDNIIVPMMAGIILWLPMVLLANNFVVQILPFIKITV